MKGLQKRIAKSLLKMTFGNILPDWDRVMIDSFAGRYRSMVLAKTTAFCVNAREIICTSGLNYFGHPGFRMEKTKICKKKL